MNKAQKVLGICMGLALILLTVAPAAAHGGGPKDGDIDNRTPVTICHATSSQTNPFTNPTVDESSIVKSSGHDGHGGDIIPAFTYYQWGVVGQEYGDWSSWHFYTLGTNPPPNTDTEQYRVVGFFIKRIEQRTRELEDVKGWVEKHYAGKNLNTLYGWGATGAEVLANGCEVPPPPYETCDETGDWVLVNTSDFTFNPDTGLMERTLSYEKYDARDQSLCDTKQVTETRPPDQRYFADATCEGWEVFKTGEGIDGDELIDAGVWENPLEDESFLYEEYGIQIDEPRDCFEIGEDFSFEADCDAWKVFALTLVDGEVVASELIDQGEWRNVYRQESVTVVVDEQEIKFYEPVECVKCKRTAIGEMFTLIGPNGEVGYLASYSQRPDGGFYIPNVESQEACLGFVAVSAPHGEIIYRDCSGDLNIVCVRCMGGADGIEGAYR